MDEEESATIEIFPLIIEAPFKLRKMRAKWDLADPFGRLFRFTSLKIVRKD